MGQVAKDLPDSQASRSPNPAPAGGSSASAQSVPAPAGTAKAAAPAAPTGGADDILSKLAGEEIDRLLAEAEEEGREKPESTGQAEGEASEETTASVETAAASASASAEDEVNAQLDQLFGQLQAESSQTPDEAPEEPEAPSHPEAALASVEQATKDVSAQLDDLFAELNKPVPEAPEPQPTQARASDLSAESVETPATASANAGDLDSALAQQGSGIDPEDGRRPGDRGGLARCCARRIRSRHLPISRKRRPIRAGMRKMSRPPSHRSKRRWRHEPKSMDC